MLKAHITTTYFQCILCPTYNPVVVGGNISELDPSSYFDFWTKISQTRTFVTDDA